MGVKLKLNKEKFIYNTKLIVEETSLHALPKYYKYYEVISLSNKENYCTLKGREIKVYKNLHYSELKLGESSVVLINSYKLSFFSLLKILMNDFVFFKLRVWLKKIVYFLKINRMVFYALLFTVLYFFVNSVFEGKVVKLIKENNIFHFLWVFIMSFFTIKKIIEFRIHFNHPDKKASDMAEKIANSEIENFKEDLKYEEHLKDSL